MPTRSGGAAAALVATMRKNNPNVRQQSDSIPSTIAGSPVVGREVRQADDEIVPVGGNSVADPVSGTRATSVPRSSNECTCTSPEAIE